MQKTASATNAVFANYYVDYILVVSTLVRKIYAVHKLNQSSKDQRQILLLTENVLKWLE